MTFSNIYGKNDVISCKNELISKSKFNKLNAINLLRFIIYDQLLFFLKVLLNNDTFSKIISKYILTIFQINHKNNRKFDIPFKEIERYREHIDFQYNNEYQIKIDSFSGASKSMLKNYFKVNNLDVFDTEEYKQYTEDEVKKSDGRS